MSTSENPPATDLAGSSDDGVGQPIMDEETINDIKMLSAAVQQKDIATVGPSRASPSLIACTHLRGAPPSVDGRCAQPPAG